MVWHASFQYTVLFLMLQSNGSTVITVVLQPRHVMFQTKTLELRDNMRIRIGRQTSSKTTPGPLNGYFDSKVLSRTHAEIWSEEGKVYIKDVKSSNGTFLNGQRLSNENEESPAMELKPADQVEFGIDISQDDGSILYHKVSCQVHIIPTSLSQVDSNMLKDLTVGFANGNSNHKLHKKASTSSLSSTSSNSTSATSSPIASNVSDAKLLSSSEKWSARNWELLLGKLQQEIQRSKDVEQQLLSAKEAIGDAALKDERLTKADARNTEMQRKLDEAHAQLSSYAEKCRHQSQAISSASQELRRLESIIRTLEQSKDKSVGSTSQNGEGDDSDNCNPQDVEERYSRLMKDLAMEKGRCKQYETKCMMLEKRIKHLEQSRKPSLFDFMQTKSFQFSLAIVVGIISALLYVLIAL
ncbi:cell cycle arrest in response to pheromone-related protein [Lichtheimia corymbifera JMRC:FSU:9682]|uniref:Cell cycle arrest in response to pheromone-related protein n=1 Tax=Lichtheimia corymbifera JMRC:FSU:9682 TaxID=1263082 RepID=A0A068S282_9FUNG|nr:cell cycle arrest in response to pheromone-related protein [Lichtheimia corymbifera JMRC:FSU:9682]